MQVRDGEAFTKQPADFGGDPLDRVALDPPMFTHVRPRQIKQASRLSKFLKGEGENFTEDFYLPDPAGFKEGGAGDKSRPFGDLRRRADDLFSLVHYGWHYELYRLPIQFVH